MLQLLGHLILELGTVNRISTPACKQLQIRLCCGDTSWWWRHAGRRRRREGGTNLPVPVGSPVCAMKSWITRWNTTPL
jgi:hypothetical protein